jgi:hypothetical protein
VQPGAHRHRPHAIGCLRGGDDAPDRLGGARRTHGLRQDLRDAKAPAAHLPEGCPEELLRAQPEAIEHRHADRVARRHPQRPTGRAPIERSAMQRGERFGRDRPRLPALRSFVMADWACLAARQAA